ncbi:hypothetical protein [Pseudobutyrivibrio sp. YE44]|uniref:hypothetical protein n=1 Tax=Pseudobutyrivibrio sp. YE44 TaxID=1520802 RepID=UPI00115FFEB5|nr:hypothetical protein [Pseudobutyrivibrio sp. YE44]
MSDGDNYYLKINDYYRIQAMREWEQSGISFMYNENAYSTIKDRFTDNVDDVINQIGGDEYSVEDKKSALNFFLYGNTNLGNNAKYKSFTDIPVDLSLQCINAFEDTFIVDEDSLSKAFSNASENIREEMEVKIPYVQDDLIN